MQHDYHIRAYMLETAIGHSNDVLVRVGGQWDWLNVWDALEAGYSV